MKLQFKDRWKSEFEKASVETVRMMLSKEPELANEPVNHVTRNGSIIQWGPLYLASVHMKDLEKVKALVAAGANLSNGPVTITRSAAFSSNAGSTLTNPVI